MINKFIATDKELDVEMYDRETSAINRMLAGSFDTLNMDVR